MIQKRWHSVTALGVFEILIWGSSYYLPAPFSKAIADETGWDARWIALGISIGLLISGLVAPRVGRKINRDGGREVLAFASLTLAAGLVLLAFAPNLWVFLAAWGVMGLGMGAGLYDAAFATLGRLYGQGARSAITQLTLLGGLASTICWPLSAFMIESWGWRSACLIYAAMHLCLSLPIALALIPKIDRKSLQNRQNLDAALRPEERLPFALMMIVQMLNGAAVVIMTVNMLALFQLRGLSLTEAIAIGALFGPAQVGARLFEVVWGNRYHPRYLYTMAVALVAAGLALLASGLPVIALGVMIFGAGNGLFSIARGALPLAVFGPERFPALVGRLARPAQIAQAVSPIFGALLLSQFGPHGINCALVAMSALNLSCAILLWRTSHRLGA